MPPAEGYYQWPLRQVVIVRRYDEGPFHSWELECGHALLRRLPGSAWEAYEPICTNEIRQCRCQACFEEAQRGVEMEDKHKDAPELPEGWYWTTCEACGAPWLAERVGHGCDTGVTAKIGPEGIVVYVMPHPPDMDGNDPNMFEIPWAVLLAVKDRAIAEARNPSEELRARAADLRPEDRYQTGDRVRYVGLADVLPEGTQHPAVGLYGTVTGFSTPKHGFEYIKTQSVLVTWDGDVRPPGVPIEGRETMVSSEEIEAVEVH